MNDEGFIFAGLAFDRERDRYRRQRSVWIEKRLKERHGWPWGELSMNGDEQAGEGVRLLIKTCVIIARGAPGAEGQIPVSFVGARPPCAGAGD